MLMTLWARRALALARERRDMKKLGYRCVEANALPNDIFHAMCVQRLRISAAVPSLDGKKLFLRLDKDAV